jgi:hypothetical protein
MPPISHTPTGSGWPLAPPPPAPGCGAVAARCGRETRRWPACRSPRWRRQIGPRRVLFPALQAAERRRNIFSAARRRERRRHLGADKFCSQKGREMKTLLLIASTVLFSLISTHASSGGIFTDAEMASINDGMRARAEKDAKSSGETRQRHDKDGRGGYRVSSGVNQAPASTGTRSGNGTVSLPSVDLREGYKTRGPREVDAVSLPSVDFEKVNQGLPLINRVGQPEIIRLKDEIGPTHYPDSRKK